ncbi:MAG: NHL repeat-containing protein [Geobacteraceae bacterium]|nr:NHL repeat-containing protein [Geobacteraceae bacterium]
MRVRDYLHKFVGIAAILPALFLVTVAPALPIGLENAGVIIPSGLESGFQNPSAIWYDRVKGFLVVANTHARQVAVLNNQGQAIKVLGKDGEIGFPVAVAVNRGGSLFVAETDSEKLKIFPQYDAMVVDFKALDLSPFRRFAPVQPAALYIDREDNLYVADRGNHQVVIFNSAGKFKSAITDAGNPADIWVDHSGSILVADPGFGGIRVYSPQGAWQRTLGASAPQFKAPLRIKALTVDRRGRIWVVEEGGQTIKALDSAGNLVMTFVSGIFSPADLALDEQDNLYVLEQGGNRISVFRISGF